MIYMQDIPHGVRLHDYCGCWLIEPQTAAALHRYAASADLLQHIADHRAAARQQNAPASADRSGNVAVVSLSGVMMKHASSLGASTSTVRTRQILRELREDESVDGVMLHIDSPGGTFAGTADLANEVKALSDVKPVHAFIEDMAASAAYWIATQADRIVVNNSGAFVGSIGTVMAVVDSSRKASKAGIEVVTFSTGPMKGTGIPGSQITEQQRAHLQRRVDDAQRGFDRAVLQGRGLTSEQLDEVKSGALLMGDEALRLNLIDEIGSFDAAVDRLRGAVGARRMDSSDLTAARMASVPSVTAEASTPDPMPQTSSTAKARGLVDIVKLSRN